MQACDQRHCVVTYFAKHWSRVLKYMSSPITKCSNDTFTPGIKRKGSLTLFLLLILNSENGAHRHCVEAITLKQENDVIYVFESVSHSTLIDDISFLFLILHVIYVTTFSDIVKIGVKNQTNFRILEWLRNQIAR